MTYIGANEICFRRSIFLREAGLLGPELPSQPAPHSDWLSLRELAQTEAQVAQGVSLLTQGMPVASAVVMPAATSTLLAKAGIAPSSLARAAFITNVAVAPGHEHLLPHLLYVAGRRARINGAATIVAGLRSLDAPAAALSGLCATPHGRVGDYALAAQRIDLWMHQLWSALAERDAQPEATLLAAEVEATIRGWVERVPQWSFFRAVREQRLSREQYVHTLSNMYQFVRHTTRVIGRAIGASADPELRKHWIQHLTGEVNHELIIERDLAHLKQDVGYVMRHMAPGPDAQQFMAIQESMIAYYNDPVMMMASPLAAEAVTAYLDQRFAIDLMACVASWGVAEPKRACQFFISHMNTDGGEDGHWRMSIDALPRLITDEARLALFLTTNGCSRKAIEGLLNACVDDMSIWSA